MATCKTSLLSPQRPAPSPCPKLHMWWSLASCRTCTSGGKLMVSTLPTGLALNLDTFLKSQSSALSTKSGHFRKPSGRPDTEDFIEGGLVALDGEKWAQHRRILNPAFFLDKLKAMAPTMGGLTVEMGFPRGKKRSFGSSFAEGKLVFEMQHKQQELISKLITTFYIPGSRFIPTTQNRFRNSLRYRIHEVLGQIIQKRIELGDSCTVTVMVMICWA
ncbi:hypothetical protein GOP47_0023352 [Adiantum capillus-veneris]|uniref:Cytochrome P450 n=1 Tax=Adiantum capillus-veneris TaxID=13818 RepID=A0A9D4Z522_ADICA|nr:hypothetical protein GOP47_0023352 [Adiantum capillus-veneris]